jgi:hypothetical protein
LLQIPKMTLLVLVENLHPNPFIQQPSHSKQIAVLVDTSPSMHPIDSQDPWNQPAPALRSPDLPTFHAAAVPWPETLSTQNPSCSGLEIYPRKTRPGTLSTQTPSCASLELYLRKPCHAPASPDGSEPQADPSDSQRSWNGMLMLRD